MTIRKTNGEEFKGDQNKNVIISWMETERLDMKQFTNLKLTILKNKLKKKLFHVIRMVCSIL